MLVAVVRALIDQELTLMPPNWSRTTMVLAVLAVVASLMMLAVLPTVTAAT